MLWHLYLKNKVKVDTINKLEKYKMPCVMSYFIYDIKSYLEYIIFGKNYLRKKRENERKEVPEGLYTKCPKCKELILTSKLKKNMSVCPHCGNHLA